MYEDTPQELVHDLIAEAVFGDHPLGRPVIGTAEVISSIPRDAIARYHDAMYVAGEHRRRGRREHRARPRRRARRARARAARATSRDGKPERAPAARASRRRPAALPAQGHRAVPRLPRRARHLALRPPPLRRVAPRRDPRRLGVVAALPGDPREARDGVRGLLVRLAVHRHRPDRRLPRHARGQPRRRARDHGRADRRHRRRQPARARARAREGEPEGPHPALDGVDLDADEPARQVADHRLGAPLARPDRRRDRRGRGRRRSASSPARCSRPSGSRRRASGRTRSGSSRRSSASRPALARAA